MYDSSFKKNELLGWYETREENFEPHCQDFGYDIGYIISCSLLVEFFKIPIFRLDAAYGGVFFLNTQKALL